MDRCVYIFLIISDVSVFSNNVLVNIVLFLPMFSLLSGCVCVFYSCPYLFVFFKSPYILLAAGAFIIRTCTVYYELSTRHSA